MSLSNRRRDLSPSRGGVGSSKLRMDRQPIVARITGSLSFRIYHQMVYADVGDAFSVIYRSKSTNR